MKGKLIFSIILIFIGFSSYSQKEENNCFKLIREEVKPSLICFKNKNWNDEFKPSLNTLGYDLVSAYIDTAKIYPIVREIISSRHFYHLNKSRWQIMTKLTGYGQIVSVSFWFKDESGVESNEFGLLAERIKKEVRWELSFNKKVNDLFYLQLSFLGPKL